MTQELKILVSLSRQKNPDWNQIDKLISNLINLPDQNLLAQEILPFTYDSDSQVRDTSMSILAKINIDHPETIKAVISRANEMAATDVDIFPAGRAVTFLLRHQPGSQLLNIFKLRVNENNWRQELLDNIPNPDFQNFLS